MKKTFLNNTAGKNFSVKRNMLALFVNGSEYSIAELSRELDTSIPTTTKIVGELIEEGFLEDLGKFGGSSGRRPNLYGLNPSAGYFVGIDIRRHHISMAVINFKGTILGYKEDIPLVFEGSEKSINELVAAIRKYVSSIGVNVEQVLSYGINLTGRVNHTTGYSFSYFIDENMPLSSSLEAKLDAPVYIDNDSRAMTYGEYICGEGKNTKDMLFINLSWGLGMGMILDGKLHYGKSGFSGEFGHFPFLDNGKICQCGKVGCLETGASGSALHEVFIEKLRNGSPSLLRGKFEKGEKITLDDILAALLKEDVLAIEAVEHIGNTLGRAIAGLINIFNPELVVIGGRLALAKEYLMPPMISAINKYSLNLVNKDTSIKFSGLGKRGGAIGACAISRSKLFGLF